MKRFTFPPQRLLDVRRQQRRLQEGKVTLALAQRGQAQQRLQQAEQQLDQLSAHIMRENLDVLQTHQSVPSTERQLETSRLELAERDERLRVAREELRRLTVAVEALETLRTQRWQEYRQEQQLAEQRDVDFVVMREWTQQQHRMELGND